MPNVFWAAFAGAAAAGLITLIAVLTAEWFRWFLDRPLVKVEMTLGFWVNRSGIKSEERQVFYEVRNPHSKPVTLDAFGLIYKGSKSGRLQISPQQGYQFPYQLDGGKLLSQWTPLIELLITLEGREIAPRDLKKVWVRASSGKVYRGNIKKWVIRDIEEELEKELKKAKESPTPSPPP